MITHILCKQHKLIPSATASEIDNILISKHIISHNGITGNPETFPRNNLHP